jgi:uncharacterized membrane protein YfcA
VPLHLLLAFALSILIGVSLGLLGGGGSILAVPVLVYVARLPVHDAIGVSLAVVGATALVGGLASARARRVDLKAAALFGGAGMLGAPLGAQLTHLLSGRVLMLLFAALMVSVGLAMLRFHGPEPHAAVRSRRPLVAAVGFGVGLLTGFLGVGGGFLIVPALTLLTGLPIHVAVGTSLLVIALNSAAGVAGHLRQGEMPLGLTGAFTAAATLGSLLGVRLAGALDPGRLRRAFAAFVILVGFALVAKNLLPG